MKYDNIGVQNVTGSVNDTVFGTKVVSVDTNSSRYQNTTTVNTSATIPQSASADIVVENSSSSSWAPFTYADFNGEAYFFYTDRYIVMSGTNFEERSMSATYYKWGSIVSGNHVVVSSNRNFSSSDGINWGSSSYAVSYEAFDLAYNPVVNRMLAVGMTSSGLFTTGTMDISADGGSTWSGSYVQRPTSGGFQPMSCFVSGNGFVAAGWDVTGSAYIGVVYNVDVNLSMSRLCNLSASGAIDYVPSVIIRGTNKDYSIVAGIDDVGQKTIVTRVNDDGTYINNVFDLKPISFNVACRSPIVEYYNDKYYFVASTGTTLVRTNMLMSSSDGIVWGEVYVTGSPATTHYFVVDHIDGKMVMAGFSGVTYSSNASASFKTIYDEYTISSSNTQTEVLWSSVYLPITNSQHEVTRWNASLGEYEVIDQQTQTMVPTYYSKISNLSVPGGQDPRFVKLIYAVTASAATGTCWPSVTASDEGVYVTGSYIGKAVSASDGNEYREAGGYVIGRYVVNDAFDPYVVKIPVNDYGKIRDVKVWVELFHDMRYSTGSGLKGLTIALKSPNVKFDYADPILNAVDVVGMKSNPDPSLSGTSGIVKLVLGDLSSTPQIRRGTYILWDGHASNTSLTYLTSSGASSGDWHEFDTDIDMRTIFTDSSMNVNPTSRMSLFPTASDTDPGSSYPLSTLLQEGKVLSGILSDYYVPVAGAYNKYPASVTWQRVNITGAYMPWVWPTKLVELEYGGVTPYISAAGEFSSAFSASPPQGHAQYGWNTGIVNGGFTGTITSNFAATTGNLGNVEYNDFTVFNDVLYAVAKTGTWDYGIGGVTNPLAYVFSSSDYFTTSGSNTIQNNFTIAAGGGLNYRSITSSPTKIVAVGDIGEIYGVYLTSTDGVNWSSGSAGVQGFNFKMHDVVYDSASDKFCALAWSRTGGGYNSYYFCTSSDGAVWGIANTLASSSQVNQTGMLTKLCMYTQDGDSKFIAYGTTGSYSYYSVSTNGGATWSTFQSNNLAGQTAKIIWDGTRLLGVGYACYALSYDNGFTWTVGSIPQVSGTIGVYRDVVYSVSASKYVAAGWNVSASSIPVGDAGNIAISSDGANWYYPNNEPNVSSMYQNVVQHNDNVLVFTGLVLTNTASFVKTTDYDTFSAIVNTPASEISYDRSGSYIFSMCGIDSSGTTPSNTNVRSYRIMQNRFVQPAVETTIATHPARISGSCFAAIDVAPHSTSFYAIYGGGYSSSLVIGKSSSSAGIPQDIDWSTSWKTGTDFGGNYYTRGVTQFAAYTKTYSSDQTKCIMYSIGGMSSSEGVDTLQFFSATANVAPYTTMSLSVWKSIDPTLVIEDNGVGALSITPVSLPVASYAASAVVSEDNNTIYYAGGNVIRDLRTGSFVDNFVSSNKIYGVKYNVTSGLVSGSFFDAGEMPVPLSNHSLRILDNVMYVIGGAKYECSSSSGVSIDVNDKMYRGFINSAGVVTDWDSIASLPESKDDPLGAGIVAGATTLYTSGADNYMFIMNGYRGVTSSSFTDKLIDSSQVFMMNLKYVGEGVRWLANSNRMDDPTWRGPAEGELQTYGEQFGAPDMRPVYPLLDSVEEHLIKRTISENSASVNRKVVGSRPGLRGTEIFGEWQLQLAVEPKFNPSDDGVNALGYQAKREAGVWIRQVRIEFLVDKDYQFSEISYFNPARRQLYRKVPVGKVEGKSLIDIKSGTCYWDAGIHYIYSTNEEQYGRRVGISTNMDDPNVAVATRLTGVLYSYLSGTPEWFLNPPAGESTPYIPISSASYGETGSFGLAEIDGEVLRSSVIDPNLPIPIDNTVSAYRSRVGNQMTSMQTLSSIIDEMIHATGSQ